MKAAASENMDKFGGVAEHASQSSEVRPSNIGPTELPAMDSVESDACDLRDTVPLRNGGSNSSSSSSSNIYSWVCPQNSSEQAAGRKQLTVNDGITPKAKKKEKQRANQPTWQQPLHNRQIKLLQQKSLDPLWVCAITKSIILTICKTSWRQCF